MKRLILGLVLLVPFAYLHADDISVTMHAINESGVNESIGVIVVQETPQGLRFQPHLQNMEPGSYVFTVNENVGCGQGYTHTGTSVPGMAAGAARNELPQLIVNSTGRANQMILAEGLSLGDVRGRTLVISRQDNPSMNISQGLEQRIACGSLELYK